MEELEYASNLSAQPHLDAAQFERPDAANMNFALGQLAINTRGLDLHCIPPTFSLDGRATNQSAFAVSFDGNDDLRQAFSRRARAFAPLPVATN